MKITYKIAPALPFLFSLCASAQATPPIDMGGDWGGGGVSPQSPQQGNQRTFFEDSSQDSKLLLANNTQPSQSNYNSTNEASTQENKHYKLDTLTTTANKYEAELSSINSSVQIASEKTLQNAQVKSTDELSNVFAGLHIYAMGGSQFPSAVLRGLSSPDFYTSVVSLYIDGIPQSPNFISQALSDVEQIELLRGPQGTLYGENAQAGVVSIRTKNPMKGDYAYVSLTGSRLYENFNAYTGGEIVKNTLWAKANVAYIHDNGYLPNPNGSGMLNTGNTFLAGLSLYYAPSSSFLATLSYSYYQANKKSPHYYTKNQLKDLKYPSNAQNATFANLGDESYAYLLHPFDKNQAHSASLKLDYSFGDSLLSSVSAFLANDTLGNSYPVVELHAGRDNGYFYDNLQFIEEIRLDSQYDNGAHSVFGIYYKYLSTDNGMRGYKEGSCLFPTDSTGNNFQAYPGCGYTDFGFRSSWRAKESVNTIALFGDGAIPLGESFDLGLGARYQFYHASMYSQVPPVDLGLIDGNKSWHSINPRISLGYHLNKHAKFYIAALQSTKQGGFVKFPYSVQDTTPYNPEQIYSLELGSHLTFTNLRANVAYYFMYIKDRQSYIGSGIYQSLKNIGDAYSTGLEFDFGYFGSRLLANIGGTIGVAKYLNGGDNRGVISILNNGAIIQQSYDVSNFTLKFSPLLTLTANIDYNFYHANKHRIYAGLNGRYLSRQYLDDLDHNSNLVQNGYAIIDLNLRYEYDKLSFKIFSQNTFDTRYVGYGRAFGGAYYYLAQNPWNLGAQIAYRY